MSYLTYKFLHLVGVFAVLLSLGGLVILRTVSADDPGWRKHLAAVNGIGMVVVFVAGFGLLARLGASWPWQGWVISKLLIWLLFGVMMILVNRFATSAKVFWWIALVAASLAAYLANFKPF